MAFSLMKQSISPAGNQIITNSLLVEGGNEVSLYHLQFRDATFRPAQKMTSTVMVTDYTHGNTYTLMV